LPLLDEPIIIIMNYDILINAITFIFGIGIIYGGFNNRMKTIEQTLRDQRDIGERLARIEEQTKLLLTILNTKHD